MSLTLEEWRALPKKERAERYKELSKHDRFLERIGAPNKDGSICPEEIQDDVNDLLDKWYNEQMKIKNNKGVK